MLDIANEFENLADTAGMMANLDLVIAVDTALAHLAGATGTAVWGPDAVRAGLAMAAESNRYAVVPRR